ncbi:aminotransferase class I/II-fold pyridoxal phosphate-dependent enzyme [Streptosporangiaceae bacterium NEAU-GS5]|nr:aminotransferase class I/II-fold pyridoxal phosphate-dependent enzyme [Streptosporangiaceae bacterium NEAU-GS5]
MGLDDLTLDEAVRRDGIKWRRVPREVIPAWVADMDFAPPPAVREAVLERIDTDLGYPGWLDDPTGGPLGPAFAERMETRYGFRTDPSHVRAFTDLNQALQIILHLMTEPGDGVLVHTPAYNAFLETFTAMRRRPVPIPLEPDGPTWRFELPKDPGGAKILVLVHPHNPTGRSFTRSELESLADYAERHDLLVISDEIHSDLTYAPHTHIPFGTLAPERTVTLTSASKAFNMGGVHMAVGHIAPQAVRDAIASQPPHIFGAAGVLGMTATVAAWRHGDAWLEEVLAILDRNRHLVAKRLPPSVAYRIPDATYLGWLDFGFPEAAEFVEREARVRLAPGPIYYGGDTCARLNFGTSGPILEEMLSRIGALDHGDEQV